MGNSQGAEVGYAAAGAVARNLVDTAFDGARAGASRWRRRRRNRHRATAFDMDFAINSMTEGSEERRELENTVRNTLEDEERRLADDEERVSGLTSGDVLLVESIDLHLRDNGVLHHTDKFALGDEGQLVVRRGQEFSLTIALQRPYRPQDDVLTLVFEMGLRPSALYGTYHELKLSEDVTTEEVTAARQWRARVTATSGSQLTVAVYVAPHAIVGQWEFSVLTVTGEATSRYRYLGSGDVTVLFNPWCPDDQVHYGGNKADLEEYVLNESGASFQGTSSSIQVTPWTYGQFQEDILDICLHLLRRANQSGSARNMSDPVLAARSLAWVVGHHVVEGNWSLRPGDYKDGQMPDHWHGSLAVLLQYWQTKQAVKYGQSWVFSHVLTTVCRALGLPCRSVTVYDACRDLDGSMTRDVYVDGDGELVDSRDVRCNFHVWNDVWMARPDLDLQVGKKGKYDGWQVVDASPVDRGAESSHRGPAPLTAVKEGEVDIGQDTKSVFAEVNADVCTWLHELPPVLLEVDTAAVGRSISTKVPDGRPYSSELGDRLRQDVTGEYKYSEGSVAERDAVRKAVGQGSMADCLLKNDSGVTVKIDKDDSGVPVGEKVPLKVRLSNSSGETRTVQLKLKVRPSNSWGGIVGDALITVLSEEKVLQPNSEEFLFYNIAARDYLRHCDHALAMRALVQCHVTGFKNPLFTSEVVNVMVPDVTVTGPATVEPETEFKVTVKFENPLQDQQMSRCWLKLEGHQIYPVDNYVLKDSCYLLPVGDIQPQEKRSMQVKVKATELPSRSKIRTLDVGLVSSLLPKLSGAFTVKLA